MENQRAMSTNLCPEQISKKLHQLFDAVSRQGSLGLQMIKLMQEKDGRPSPIVRQ
jgi:hypothetical protein